MLSSTSALQADSVQNPVNNGHDKTFDQTHLEQEAEQLFVDNRDLCLLYRIIRRVEPGVLQLRQLYAAAGL